MDALVLIASSIITYLSSISTDTRASTWALPTGPRGMGIMTAYGCLRAKHTHEPYKMPVQGSRSTSDDVKEQRKKNEQRNKQQQRRHSSSCCHKSL